MKKQEIPYAYTPYGLWKLEEALEGEALGALRRAGRLKDGVLVFELTPWGLKHLQQSNEQRRQKMTPEELAMKEKKRQPNSPRDN